MLADPRLNKRSAFTDSNAKLGLVGLLPQRVETIDQQLARVRRQLSEHHRMLAKNVYLRELHDRNETLFYRLLIDDLPGSADRLHPDGGRGDPCTTAFRRPRGVAIPLAGGRAKAFGNLGLGPDDVDLIPHRLGAILGIGDWGVGGIDIAIGKIGVYVAAAGVDPGARSGGDRRRDGPHQTCSRIPATSVKHAVRGSKYDDLIDRYVTTATEMFPNALLHWEDFGRRTPPDPRPLPGQCLHVQRRHAGHRCHRVRRHPVRREGLQRRPWPTTA